MDNTGVRWNTTWQWTGGHDNVKSYAHSECAVEKKLLSGFTSLRTTARWTYTQTDNDRANVAYDTFTSADPQHRYYNGDYEVMLWLVKFGDMNPLGSLVATPTVAEHDWQLFSGINPNRGVRVFTFITGTGPITDFEGDLKDFFDYLGKNFGFPSNQYLFSLQFGTETLEGGPTSLSVEHWSIDAVEGPMHGQQPV